MFLVNSRCSLFLYTVRSFLSRSYKVILPSSFNTIIFFYLNCLAVLVFALVLVRYQDSHKGRLQNASKLFYADLRLNLKNHKRKQHA